MRRKLRDNINKLKWNVNHMILFGIVLIVVVSAVCGKLDKNATEQLMKETLGMLKEQCANYDQVLKEYDGALDIHEVHLRNLLNGQNMERKGIFFIVKDGEILASNRHSLAGKSSDGIEVIQKLRTVSKEDKLYPFSIENNGYYGGKSSYRDYKIYIYFSHMYVYGVYRIFGVIFTCIYISLCLFYFASKNSVLKQSQEELLKTNGELEEKMGMLHSLENIFISIFYVTLPQNRYESIFLAPWFPSSIDKEGIYSEAIKELIQRTVMDEYREDLQKALTREYIQNALNKDKLLNAKNSYYMDYQVVEKGQIKWRRLTVSVVDWDDYGNPKHILILLQDVNKEKEKEHKYQIQILREAKKAKHANEAKTEFLRRISHDIRTPINGIQGMVKMAQHCPNDKKKQKEYWEKVWTSSQFLLDLVNDVLDMSKLESGKIVLENRTFSLAALLGEVDILLESHASQQNIRYITDEKADVDEYLIGSPLHVRQILLNIGGNAIKYGKEGGYIKVKSKMLAREEDMVIYEFICEDNGIGMTKEFQEKMFEPFVQEKDDARTSYQGTGLGLSIVDKLVKKMKGAIEVTSEKGVGTTFKITIPFEIDQTVQKIEEAGCGEGALVSLKGMRALLVEDNALNMEITEFMLEEQGILVTKAWNGEEAVEIFKNSEEGAFDIILMDIMMPVMNGIDASREIRSLDHTDAGSVPIIAITANAFSDDMERSREAGMNDHISKPIDEDKLMEAVRRCKIGD